VAASEGNEVLKKPLIKAVVLDFSVVTHVDTTAVQNLVDARAEIEKWADGPVEFHFAQILSPWIRRALIAGGFGVGRARHTVTDEVAPVVPPQHQQVFRTDEEEFVDTLSKREAQQQGPGYLGRYPASQDSSLQPILNASTPFFHLDLTTAVKSAEAGVTGYDHGGKAQES